MSQLNFVAVGNKFLARLLELLVTRVAKYIPEISDAEDGISSLKRPLKGLNVVKVTLDDFDTFGCPRFGGGGFGVTSYAANGVARCFKKGISNRASLDIVLKRDGGVIDHKSC
jgi:hypothetical protein